MRLYLVRHGQTSWNVEQRAQGHTDIPLDEEGIRQADMLGHSFAGVGIDRVLSSDLKRSVQTAEQMAEYVETALKDQANGTALPFVQIEKTTGRVIGSTRYANIDRRHHRVEIGWSWIGQPWQRTVVNTESKYLLLRHAFETLGCMRVELKTDSLNAKSRAAILRIGAREEGTFRKHMITSNGRIRHTVYFSIVDAEWPEVRSRLELKLGQSSFSKA